VWRSYVALGDSFTEGLDDPVGPLAPGVYRGWADRLAAHLDQRTPGLLYANLAIRGRTLARVIEEQVPAAVAMSPDLVTIGAGVNDAMRRGWDPDRLATTYEEGVAALRATGATVVMVGFGDPGLRGGLIGRFRERFVRLNADVHRIAGRHGCAVVDFWPHPVFAEDRFWSEDRLHLNSRGHAVAARAALHALGLADDSWTRPAGPSDASVPWALQRAADARWAGRHLAPWVVRRLRGVSSGDGISPKRPHLTTL